ncbi:MAG: Gfo/Idh/MocA family oxidoreductase [Thermoguttaceae bacterium]|jgi:predicted dehydrogenase|nr:Gfo/Idh/MocA family oxidoreductase [Thermoguttaceae bacterium]
MKTIRFGIIGCGLMGREFASAAARWCHLAEPVARPEIVAVCNRSPGRLPWFERNFPSICLATTDYRELLACEKVDAVYCAVPHHMHQAIYCEIISAGKHLLGEKPFGMELEANTAILGCVAEHPEVFVRCSSEFPFFPAVQRIGRMIEQDQFGRLIEVNSGFLHSSDLDPDKPINWKRMAHLNGEYGCMGDLGMHACHVPFRAGWTPRSVRAVLSNLMPTRPDGKGGTAPCDTWDNATLLCEARTADGHDFPLVIRTHRIAPGEKNTWYIEIKGTRGCARFSTKNPRRLDVLEYTGGEQVWQRIDMGYETAYPAITGGIFEFGFTDAIQQMWSAFVSELAGSPAEGMLATCVKPEETALSHRLFTAALRSQRDEATVSI